MRVAASWPVGEAPYGVSGPGSVGRDPTQAKYFDPTLSAPASGSASYATSWSVPRVGSGRTRVPCVLAGINAEARSTSRDDDV
eukprot:1426723-Rhodomonas_salina.1